MITIEDIRTFKLNRDRLDAHIAMPPPRFSKKRLTTQISAISDAVISKLAEVTPSIFSLQLEAAREFGVSYLLEDQNQNVIGLSASTSVINSDNIMNKNLILPCTMTTNDPRLNQHYIVGVFVNSPVYNEELNIDDVSNNIRLAGWINTRSINQIKQESRPPFFNSKLPVVMVPCTRLQPITTLVDQLTAFKVTV